MINEINKKIVYSSKNLTYSLDVYLEQLKGLLTPLSIFVLINTSGFIITIQMPLVSFCVLGIILAFLLLLIYNLFTIQHLILLEEKTKIIEYNEVKSDVKNLVNTNDLEFIIQEQKSSKKRMNNIFNFFKLLITLDLVLLLFLTVLFIII